MTLSRTLTAICNGCGQTQEMNPDTTQPWNDLVKIGWGVDSAKALDYCPKCKIKENCP